MPNVLFRFSPFALSFVLFHRVHFSFVPFERIFPLLVMLRAISFSFVSCSIELIHGGDSTRLGSSRVHTGRLYRYQHGLSVGPHLRHGLRS